MRNDKNVSEEDDHFFVTGTVAEPAEKTRENGIIYLEDRPVAFASTDEE